VFSLFGKKKRPEGPSLDGRRRLCVPEMLYKRIINHCGEEKPLEACGLLVGVGSHVVGAYATDNQHRSPVVYQADERQVLQVLRECQSNRQDLIGIYHSHVRTPAEPSQTDIDQATWPEAYYVIVSLAGRRPVMRAWRIIDRHVTEHPVLVMKETAGQWHDLRAAVRAARGDAPPGDTTRRSDID